MFEVVFLGPFFDYYLWYWSLEASESQMKYFTQYFNVNVWRITMYLHLDYASIAHYKRKTKSYNLLRK